MQPTTYPITWTTRHPGIQPTSTALDCVQVIWHEALLTVTNCCLYCIYLLSSLCCYSTVNCLIDYDYILCCRGVGTGPAAAGPIVWQTSNFNAWIAYVLSVVLLRECCLCVWL